jgi:hypothetical protein
MPDDFEEDTNLAVAPVEEKLHYVLSGRTDHWLPPFILGVYDVRNSLSTPLEPFIKFLRELDGQI